ncbi:exopolysaccharide biosynthesis polyprenyl glycosylphosphotransferase [Alkalitalea saponilacus]|uniref:Exopolysaccharide biosynthesis polyprenyl glycosylphosphotransferase n=1 Tax=Alkalitalea saponilacus TaxID=889453 RepID=A0A1T5BF03_9BACT|nr:exopolysaccharide biosynthesis polyprenyl glycosylphosphotransferase [Alkalitalea saponilacus]
MPGLITLVTDFLTGVLILNIFTALVISTNLTDFSLPIDVSPKIWIPFTFIVVFSIFGSYKTDTSIVGQVSIKRPLVILGLYYLTTLVAITYFEPTSGVPSRFLLKVLVVTVIYAATISINRLLIHLTFTMLLKTNILSHKVLLVFHNFPSNAYFKEFLRYIGVNNLTLSGYCGTERIKPDFHPEIPYLGRFDNAPDIVKEYSIDEVIIFNHSQKTRQTEKILTEINTEEVLVRLAPGSTESIPVQIGVSHLTEIPVVSIRPRSINLGYKLSKRILDISVAVPGLILTAIIYPFLSWKIRRNSPGPVFFKQERLGKNGNQFTMYKFRTMHVNAEENGPQLAAKGDDRRITETGRFLRQTHMDELPQFWNILKGEMSLVGPRPERAYFASQVEKETPYYKFILQVKPGLTSLGMIKYGYAHNVNEMTERLIYDVIYINNLSIIADLKIIGSTMVYILKKIFFRQVETKSFQSETINIQTPKQSDPNKLKTKMKA